MGRGVLAAAAVLALSAPTAAAAASGLRGAVSRGPTTPVCRAGTPCAAPAAHVLLVFTRPGRRVEARSNARGRYAVVLPPGTWHVSTVRIGVGGRLSPQTVRVLRDRMRIVDFSIDTGIR